LRDSRRRRSHRSRASRRTHPASHPTSRRSGRRTDPPSRRPPPAAGKAAQRNAVPADASVTASDRQRSHGIGSSSG
jgi:hypothetical protein